MADSGEKPRRPLPSRTHQLLRALAALVLWIAFPRYNHPMRLKNIPTAYRVTIKGLVYDEAERLLFVRERGDAWDLPGGGLEHGEDALEVPKREFLEELNQLNAYGSYFAALSRISLLKPERSIV